MPPNANRILSILDQCCDAFTFPMLDNGYVYLAATRLSLYRTPADWAMVIEVFGFSPRAGLPDTHVHTFASTLRNRDVPERYATREAYDNYLSNNPNNESRFFYPIAEGPWQDTENCEIVAEDVREVVVRGNAITLPSVDDPSHKHLEMHKNCLLLSSNIFDLPMPVTKENLRSVMSYHKLDTEQAVAYQKIEDAAGTANDDQ